MVNGRSDTQYRLQCEYCDRSTEHIMFLSFGPVNVPLLRSRRDIGLFLKEMSSGFRSANGSWSEENHRVAE